MRIIHNFTNMPSVKKTDKVYIVIGRDLKQAMCERIEIFGIPLDQSKFDEVKIEEVKNKKGEDRSSCPYHEL